MRVFYEGVQGGKTGYQDADKVAMNRGRPDSKTRVEVLCSSFPQQQPNLIFLSFFSRRLNEGLRRKPC